MKIAEIFYSVQGEGTLLGVPSVFIRTSGCNLRCAWCDTPYTSWKPIGDNMELDLIVQHALEYPGRHAVVTGGEPMIAPRIGELTNLLRDAGFHITIETAGTVFHPVACDLMSISPKLSNSTPEGVFAIQHERLRIQPTVLKTLMSSYDYQLKFVISHSEDFIELKALLATLEADPRKVVLMPEGITPAILHERSLWLTEICKDEGFRYSPRLHIDLWGNRPGV